MNISKQQARNVLLATAGLSRWSKASPTATMDVLRNLRAVQLDPLDPFLTNAELVMAARLSGYRKGMLLHPSNNGQYSEQWFKERCLIPSESFAPYRQLSFPHHWWRNVGYLKSVDPKTVDRVLSTIADAGPVTRKELDMFGNVEPHDWSGWTGTKKAIGVALEVLWTDTRIAVVGRDAKGKRLYDIPERHFAMEHSDINYAKWAILQRIQSSGIVSTNAGPIWRTLRKERTSGLLQTMQSEGEIAMFSIEGIPGTYISTQEKLDKPEEKPDQNMRILGPLDNFLWDRKLLARVFDFDYVWEVYKPAAKRLWGWYVVPLLYKGTFVGRVELHRQKGELRVKQMWRERTPFPETAWQKCFARMEKTIAPSK